jgi:hypothetical protein
MKRIAVLVLALVCMALPGTAQTAGTAAKMVVWEPKPGMERSFEEGYKRHLEWHRRNNDPWVWHGWTLLAGERAGWFVDGSFFHPWTDFDSPMKPAEDGADNAVNVSPHAEVRNVGIVESVPALSNVQPDGLKSPLMIFLRLSIAAGSEAKLEAAIGSALQGKELSGWQRLVLRPASGWNEYVLMIPTMKSSEVGAQQQRIRNLLEALQGSGVTITKVENELARYRTDMSYSRQ